MQIFHTPISGNESRLLKTCDSIIALKLVDKVFIIGQWTKGMDVKTKVSDKIEIIRIKTLLNRFQFKRRFYTKFIALLSLIKHHYSVMKQCAKIKPDFVSCHSLDILPLCILLKYLFGSKLLYEPHELETERAGLRYKSFSKIIERLFIKHCDKVVTVCEPITNFYKKKYNLDDEKITTIRNIPVNPNLGNLFPKTDLFRNEFNISKSSLIFLYQGLIDKHRGILNYLETFVKLDSDYHLIIMGYGGEVSMVEEYSNKYKNIHYKSAVPVNEIVKYTSSADVGLFIIPGDLPLSYKYALPNKFYEYAIAGLHICVSDNFQFLKEIVEDKKLGSIISSDTTSLYNWIRSFQNCKKNLLIPSDKSIEFRKNCGWQNEERSYIKLYSSKTEFIAAKGIKN